MGCHYPSCYMGNHWCLYEKDCEEEERKLMQQAKEQNARDAEEQRLRIALMKKELGETK